MSPKENLIRLIRQMPDSQVAELERMVVAMLRPEPEVSQPPDQRMSFEEAKAYTFETFDNAFRNLAK